MTGIPTFATTATQLTLVTGETLDLQPGTNQVLVDLKGWHSSPGTRRNSTPRLWAHGTFSERGWRDERLISLVGHVYTSNRGDAARMTDTLNAALADGTAGTFTVLDADLGKRSATVFMTGTPTVDWDGNLDVHFVVDMVAPDPRKYGDVVTFKTDAAAPGGGLAFDLFGSSVPGVLDFGVAGADGTVTAENAGTADTAPILTITGPCPLGFTITELTTGARLIYTGAVEADHFLVMDAADGSVLLDGYADRSASLARREWTRIPGSTRSTYLFESPGNTGSLSIGVAPAWW